jgi:hypothetical protein
METIDDPNTIASTKAERRTALQFDFDLEDIIAGNHPDGEIGQRLKAIVDDAQTLPTQGKIEAALLPLYEAAMAEFYRQEGGTAQPPAANRHNVQEHAVKVIQARKVKKTALLRAARTGSNAPAAPASQVTRLQLISIAGLVLLIAAVFYFKS